MKTIPTLDELKRRKRELKITIAAITKSRIENVLKSPQVGDKGYLENIKPFGQQSDVFEKVLGEYRQKLGEIEEKISKLEEPPT